MSLDNTIPYTANVDDLSAFLRGGFGDEIAFSVSWLQPALANYNPLRRIARVRTVLRAPFEHLLESTFIPGQSVEDFLDSCARNADEERSFVHGVSHIHGFNGFLGGELNIRRAGIDHADDLVDLVQSTPAGLRVRSRFAMSEETLRHCRRIRTADGGMIWRADASGETLLGFPVEVTDAMPDARTRQPTIGFGDWSRFFEIRDGGTVTVRRKGPRALIVSRTVDCEVRAPSAVRFLAF